MKSIHVQNVNCPRGIQAKPRVQATNLLIRMTKPVICV
jgi:hypothetical protein